jgi:hypothetical protein
LIPGLPEEIVHLPEPPNYPNMPEQIKSQKRTTDEEITFRDLVLKLLEYLRELVSHWKWILFSGLLLAIVLVGKALLTQPVYPATLSFMINEDNGNPLGSISGVLGSFGISSRSRNNPEKVLELARSRRIVENSLFRNARIGDSTDLLANHLITYLDTLEKFNKKAWYRFGDKTDTLPRHLDPVVRKDPRFTEGERMVLKKLFREITGHPDSGDGGMLESRYNETSRIMYLTIRSKNPELSLNLTNTLFDELSEFYVRKTVEKQQTTYLVVKAKTDSIRYVLENKEQQLAALEDSWLGRYSQQSKLTEKKLEKEIRLLNITLAESLKNQEIADFAVRNTMPYVQTIDRPTFPLDTEKPSPVRNALLGLLLGVLLSGTVIGFRKLFRDAMNG